MAGLCIEDDDVDRVMEKKQKNRKEPEKRASIKQVESVREKVSKKVKNSLKQGIYLPLYHLARIFQLTPFELDIVLVCLAPELDVKYEKLYAYLQDDVTKKSPAVYLILDLLCNVEEERIDARACFFNQSPLLKYQLVRFMEESQSKPLISRCVKLDDRIVNFLLEQNVMDSDFEISSFAKIINPTRDWSSVVMGDDLNERLSRLKEEFFKKGERGTIIFYLKGPYGVGKKLTAEAFCYEMKLPMIIVDMNELLMSSNDSQSKMSVEKNINRLFRETLLQPAAIYLEHFDNLVSDNPREIHYQNVFVRALEEFSFVTFLAGEKSWNPLAPLKKLPFIKIEFSIPTFLLRKQLWKCDLYKCFV